MNRSGKNAPPPIQPPSKPIRGPSHAAGFTLVEVLVTALIISVGMLGMATLQGRTILHTSETLQRSTAAMMANDLMELIRAAPSDWSSHLRNASAPRPSAHPCPLTPGKPEAQLACWLAEIAFLLPSSSQLPSGQSYVCRSPSPGTCAGAGAGRTIEIQVAWKGSHSECLNTQKQCHYRLRSEIEEPRQ